MLSPDYVVGLVDGEGCFYVNVRPQRPHTRRPHVETHFYVKLVEEDRHLLEEVNDTFECGRIYIQRDGRKNHRACYRYEVNSRKDIQSVIVPFFKKHPLHSQKKNDFNAFCEVVEIIREGRHKTSEGLESVQRIKDRMNIKARRVRKIRTLGGNAK